jgi:S-adenosylmethionine:tRNA ribosyltransferase-isomerase
VKLSDFMFDLPQELIAQHPPRERDSSRMMVIHRRSQSISHHRFAELPDLLGKDDLLVVNNTKVFPARIQGRKKNGSAKVEILLLRELDHHLWEVLLRPAKRLSPGTRISFIDEDFEAVVEPSVDPMKRRIRFSGTGDLFGWLERVGHVPLPPYIRRYDSKFEAEDRSRYQTIYATMRGSVAAPTAGLHFTPSILNNIQHCEITLHVGYGTFKPVSVENIEEHRMDPEFFTIGDQEARKIQQQLQGKNRIISVGTTSTRTLEHLMKENGEISAGSGWTDLFIFPGYQFRAVSGLITNFHLPGSTLILLVCAFAGKELVLEAYRQAIDQKYRFYSYGDAMLIL